MGEEASKKCIKYAKLGDLGMLKHLYETDPEVRDSYVYQRVLLNACAQNQLDVAKWLLELYTSFDFITKTALRHTLIHGKYLIKEKESRALYQEWCNIILLPIN